MVEGRQRGEQEDQWKQRTDVLISTTDLIGKQLCDGAGPVFNVSIDILKLKVALWADSATALYADMFQNKEALQLIVQDY